MHCVNETCRPAPEAVIQGGTYRFTVLTGALIRLEYSEIGVFTDRPTQTVLNRSFPVPAFRVEETEDSLQIFTSGKNNTRECGGCMTSSGIISARAAIISVNLSISA